jgi:periplasmic divalent cation tolerance protein
VSQTDFVIVLTTFPADADAVAFANTLVEARLAACVNISGDIQSVYQWEGRIEHDAERQLVIKTSRASVERLWERVRDLHPYEVPEFLVLPVIDGSDMYLTWIRTSTEVYDPTS